MSRCARVYVWVSGLNCVDSAAIHAQRRNVSHSNFLISPLHCVSFDPSISTYHVHKLSGGILFDLLNLALRSITASAPLH